MKEKTNIKMIHKTLYCIGLVVLLCISPCKVRNYIQSEFGGHQTEASNKSQTTIGTSSCNVFNASDFTYNAEKVPLSYASALPVNIFSFTTNTIEFSRESNNIFKNGSHSLSVIPYYILFQNFKVYL